MRAMNFFAVILVIIFGLNMAACCGPDAKTDVKTTQIINQPTVGQQLEDLDKAYKSGALTKEEYEKVRKDIIEKGGKPEEK